MERLSRFVCREKGWRVMMWLMVFLSILVGVELRLLRDRAIRVKERQAQIDLVRRIPAMEQELADREARQEQDRLAEEERQRLEAASAERLRQSALRIAAARERRAARQAEQSQGRDRRLPVLEGISSVDGMLSALIEGKIYQVGDPLGEYFVIQEINLQNVVLQDRVTKEIHLLFVFLSTAQP